MNKRHNLTVKDIRNMVLLEEAKSPLVLFINNNNEDAAISYIADQHAKAAFSYRLPRLNESETDILMWLAEKSGEYADRIVNAVELYNAGYRLRRIKAGPAECLDVPYNAIVYELSPGTQGEHKGHMTIRYIVKDH